jgi:hypothetical protein
MSKGRNPDVFPALLYQQAALAPRTPKYGLSSVMMTASAMEARTVHGGDDARKAPFAGMIGTMKRVTSKSEESAFIRIFINTMLLITFAWAVKEKSIDLGLVHKDSSFYCEIYKYRIHA